MEDMKSVKRMVRGQRKGGFEWYGKILYEIKESIFKSGRITVVYCY